MTTSIFKQSNPLRDNAPTLYTQANITCTDQAILSPCGVAKYESIKTSNEFLDHLMISKNPSESRFDMDIDFTGSKVRACIHYVETCSTMKNCIRHHLTGFNKSKSQFKTYEFQQMKHINLPIKMDNAQILYIEK